MSQPLSPAVLLLDGSMGHELKARGLTESFATAMHANATHSELVTAVHAEYVAAGCDVLTTNTFTLTPHAVDGREGELAALLSVYLSVSLFFRPRWRCRSRVTGLPLQRREERVCLCSASSINMKTFARVTRFVTLRNLPVSNEVSVANSESSASRQA